MTRARDIGLASLLLLLYLGLRLHHLLALPLFIDETLHAERAVSVWQGSPLWFGANGKLLGAWWIALFDPFPAWPWLLRAAILLLTLPGAAAAMTLARRLYGRAAALLAGLLLVFAPMLFFFDRMSLADTTLHPLLTLFVLSLFWLLDDGPFRHRRAMLSGLLLAAAILAKATAIMIVPLPLLAVWILGRGWRTADRIQALAGLFGTTLVIWLPLLGVMGTRGINYLGVPLSEHSTQASQLLLIDRWLAVTGFLLDGLTAYFGVVPLVVAAVAMLAAVVARPRQGLVLAMAVGGPVVGVIAAGNLGASLRYWLNVIPLALAWTAGGLVVLGQRLTGRHGVRLIPFALVGAWIVLVALPFIQTAYADPAALNLPEKDRLEYLEADSAGTMLPELAAYLTAENARLVGDLVVTGAISQCAGLALYLLPASGIQLDCPRIFSEAGRGAALDAHVTALAAEHPHYVVIFENPGLVPVTDVVSLRLNALADFPRPGGRVTLTVYQPAP